MPLRSMVFGAALAGSALGAAPACAQAKADRTRALEARVEAQDAPITELESLLRASMAHSPSSSSSLGADSPAPMSAPATVAASGAVQTVVRRNDPAAVASASPLDISGDFRMREEFNWSDRDARDRSRTVLRARLRASYVVNSKIMVGTQLTADGPNDPNSTDLTLWGGKFANPVRRTDLLWDGDGNPQGVAASSDVDAWQAVRPHARLSTALFIG